MTTTVQVVDRRGPIPPPHEWPRIDPRLIEILRGIYAEKLRVLISEGVNGTVEAFRICQGHAEVIDKLVSVYRAQQTDPDA